MVAVARLPGVNGVDFFGLFIGSAYNIEISISIHTQAILLSSSLYSISYALTLILPHNANYATIDDV
jgi:hypothetical protein